jgi:hypothetical protein
MLGAALVLELVTVTRRDPMPDTARTGSPPSARRVTAWVWPPGALTVPGLQPREAEALLVPGVDSQRQLIAHHRR